LLGHWRSEIDPSDLDRAIMDYGLDHERRIAEQLDWPTVPDPGYDFAEGHRATVELLSQGVPGVYQAVLELPPMRGKPDLLRRVEGLSALGEFHYEPGDIKSSLRSRGEQIAQVVVYALMLEQVQQRRPTNGFLILRDGHEERFAIADYDLAVEDALADMVGIRAGSQPAPDLHLHLGCANCRWREACTTDAIATDDISLVPAVPRAYRAALRTAGLETSAALAACDPTYVALATGLPELWIAGAVLRARARSAGMPIPISAQEHPFASAGQTAIAVFWELDLLAATRPVVMAAYQARTSDGVLRKPRLFLASNPEQARSIVKSFVRQVDALITELSDAPILVAGARSTGDLAATHGTTQIAWLPRVVDVTAVARRRWALPRATTGPADLLAALNDERRQDSCLPFSVASPEHPALLYRRLYGRGDTLALDRLKSVVSGELGALLGLFDRLRMQS
jgi:predicted RecB family nuclease